MRTAAICAVLAIGSATVAPVSYAQRPVYELRGAVAVFLRSARTEHLDERSRRACAADDVDINRRIQFLLGQTRLVVATDRAAFERHPEFQRLVAAKEVAARALPQAVTSSLERHLAALQQLEVPLDPWRHPLHLRVTMLSFATRGGECAQSINFTVFATVVDTRVRSSTARTSIGFLPIFSRDTLLVGYDSEARPERIEIIEGYVRDFANAWVEANR